MYDTIHMQGGIERQLENHRAALAGAGLAFFECDNSLKVLSVGGCAETLTGFSRSELVGEKLTDKLHPEAAYARAVEEIYASTLLSGLAERHVFETDMTRADGEKKNIEWTAQVRKDEGGRIVSVLSLARDNRNKEMEERVRRLILESKRKNHVLEELDRKNRKLRQLIRNYTPRTTYNRACAIVERGDVEIPNEFQVRTFLFLDVTGFTSFCEDKSPDTIVAALNDIFQTVTETLLAHNGDIDKFIGDAIFTIFESPLDACTAALEIREKMRESDGPFQLRMGISTGRVIRGNVGGESRKDYTAIGDAVNVASRLEKACPPGEILLHEDTYEQVSDSVRVISRSTLTLRGKDAPIKACSIGRANEEGIRTGEILLVDDSPTQKNIQIEILRQKGVNSDSIFQASNGQEALEKVRMASFKLIIADWNMPVMNGLDFIRELRKCGISTPVIMVTSESEREKFVAALEAGADGFLSKPVTKQKLWEAVSIFLN